MRRYGSPKNLIVRLVIASALAAGAAPIIAAQDASEPKKTLAAFLSAVQAGDEERALQLVFHAKDKKEASTTKVLINLLVQPQRLYKAVKTKFKDKAAQVDAWPMGKDYQSYLEQAKARLVRAAVRIQGDSATVRLPETDEKWELLNPLEQEIVLVKVKEGWRLDLAKTMQVEKVSEFAENAMFQEMSKRIRVIGQFAQAIDQDKFKTFDEFKDRYESWQDGELEDPFKEQ